jgi:hypothetical protein
MKTIKNDELFQGLNDFFKVKGIEFKDGAYTERIRRACNLLGDAVNATQTTARKAKAEAGKKLQQVRQRIHEATAPESATPPASKPEPSNAPKAKRPVAGRTRQSGAARSRKR